MKYSIFLKLDLNKGQEGWPYLRMRVINLVGRDVLTTNL